MLLFQFPETAVNLTSRFNTEETLPPTGICYADKHPIILTGHFSDNEYFQKVKVFHEDTRIVLKELKKCHRVSSIMSYKIEGKEYLLEGCPICQVIRSYQLLQADNTSTILKEDIRPHCLFKGPEETVLVFDKENSSILKMNQSEGQFRLLGHIKVVLEDVQGLCYCSRYDIVIALHSDGKGITGIQLATGQVAWQHSEIQFDSSPCVVDQINGIVTLPDDRVCLFDDNKLYALNPEDGTIISTVLNQENFWRIWAVSTYNIDNHKKLAIAHSEMEQDIVSIYHFCPNVGLPLRQIISG